jgi:hypothetical protein
VLGAVTRQKPLDVFSFFSGRCNLRLGKRNLPLGKIAILIVLSVLNVSAPFKGASDDPKRALGLVQNQSDRGNDLKEGD